MKIIDSHIPDVKIIEPTIFGDERGFFMETWNHEKFNHLVAKCHFVQDNHSKSKKGILRGLHYQTENIQGKLVRVISGEVYDVAVDMRKGSDSFGGWVGVHLSEGNKRQLWIPEGFAHSFYVISDQAEFVYKCTDYYNPKSEVSVRWDDKTIGINWPVNGNEPSLSEKDSAGVSFNDAIYL